MNTRELTKIMLGILAVLCLLIALSALNNKSKEEKMNDDEEIYEGEENLTDNYIEETNIEIINFFDLYEYFENDEACENMQRYLAMSLAEYKTQVEVFDTKDINYDNENKTLTFNLVSQIAGLDEEYKVTIKETETTLERIK